MFKNCKEEWEVVNRKSDDMQMWLRNEYNGMRLHDIDENEGIDEKRLIISISWQNKRPKGYRVVTGLIKSNGNVDESEEQQQDHAIDVRLHSLITAEMNPTVSFRS